MNEELKLLIEKNTGVKIDGEVTIADVKAVYDFLKPILDKVFPLMNDKIDEGIDRVEAVAMKGKSMKKFAILQLCGAIRKIANCPDDDDNITQK